MQSGYYPSAPGQPAHQAGATPAVPDALARLASSARGWHSIQLAVLGFIGICGVLRTGDGGDEPSWLRWFAALLAILALALACLATYLVGRVAYPFHGAGGLVGGAGPDQLEGSSRRLRSGIRITFLAVGALALASVSAWWPGGWSGLGGTPGAAGGTVAVQVVNGQRVCGTLLDAPTGTVRLDTAQGTVSIRLADLSAIRSVDGC